MKQRSDRLFRSLKPNSPYHMILPIIAVHLDGIVGGIVSKWLAVGDEVDHEEPCSSGGGSDDCNF